MLQAFPVPRRSQAAQQWILFVTGGRGPFEDGGGLKHTVTSPTTVNAVLPSTIIPPPSYLSVAGLCALF